jgi:hypothetical protein
LNADKLGIGDLGFGRVIYSIGMQFPAIVGALKVSGF